MIWTKDKLWAAKILGLDPENPRHRDLLERCIGDAQAPLPVRGRPRGTVRYSDEALSTMAYLVDLLKAIHSRRFGRLSDEELLGHGLWGIGGQIVRCSADPKEWGFSDLSLENTITLLPVGTVKPLAVCLLQKEGGPETPLDIVARVIPHLNAAMVWRWPVFSGLPVEKISNVAPGTFRNLLARGREIRRSSGAPGVPEPRSSNLHE
jgi:hypothetical protein